MTELSPLAQELLVQIHRTGSGAVGAGTSLTSVSLAEYELQKAGLIAFGCCGGRFLSIEGLALARELADT